MILCLDCGNSRLKWGLRDGNAWRAGGALEHKDIALLAAQLPTSEVTEVIGCNVAGDERARQIEAALSRECSWIKSIVTQCGVFNGYDEPARLGADRWAALIAAHTLYAGPALVVLAGTATTVDVIDADGRHLGGVILPGLDLMASALTKGTVQLPQATGRFQPLPRNTDDAIISGALQATLGAVQRMFAQLPSSADALCLLAGGAVAVLQPHLDLPCRRIDTLVLDGLVRIAATTRFDTA